MEAKTLRADFIEARWRDGDLRYKMKGFQREVWDQLWSTNGWLFVIKCARRIGKTYLLCLIAVMVCLRKPRSKVKFAAPHKENLKNLLEPIMRKIIADAPEGLCPVYKSGRWSFPHNGSELLIHGVNNATPDALRGDECDLFIVDEGGTVRKLEYVVKDVGMPQLMNQDGEVIRGRKMIVASSPAKTPAHEFTTMSQEAEIDGRYAHYDIYDGEYSAESIDMLMHELKGPGSVAWQREALALDLVDPEFALCPEWEENGRVEDFSLDEYYPFYCKYGALDTGVRDLTVDLAAHYDFKKATLFVHDEVAMNGTQMTTETLGKAIRQMEVERFGVKWEEVDDPLTRRLRFKMVPPDEHFKIKRVSDIDLLLISDLSKLEGIYYEATDKGYIEEMVNEVRVWVQNRRLVVHPRCKQLIGCLRFGVWNDHKTDFDRSSAYGHFDAFAALMYLIRNVDTRSNPIPSGYGRPADDYFIEEAPNDKKEKLRKMMGIRQRRRPGELY